MERDAGKNREPKSPPQISGKNYIDTEGMSTESLGISMIFDGIRGKNSKNTFADSVSETSRPFRRMTRIAWFHFGDLL
jgi:hypothetical protein